MKYSNTVEYNIKTSLDSKGLTQLKSELQGLELKLQNMGNKGFLDEKTFVDARNQIQGLGQALTDAFNPSLGMLDLSKLNQELKNNDVTAQGLKTAFSSLGAEGQVAFNNLVGELGKLDTGILRTNSQIDKLFTTFSNTFRWGLVSSFFSQFMNAIHNSVSYVKELDDSLTQIMLVTDYNRDSMNQFAKSANEAAKAVSMTTTGMTNASLIFAQQGYDLGQSQELATLSAKLANASQQDTATTSDQITAYMNAYGLEGSIEELTQQMDNWALIANVSAADVGELAQASQRAASMANAVGVSGEQLAAQIATIESVTREAPEQIGNGLKTLYARFSDIAAGGEDEDGFGLGKVTAELEKIGVQVLNEMGQIRDVGDIMEDLMVIWDDLDQTSKVAASQALAGKYQVNRFMALMDNSDMYQEYKGATGSAATGTLDQMNEEFANSIEGRSAKLQASLEGLFSTIFNTDDIYPWMDAAQGAVDLLQQFFDALGGGKTVLLGISSLLMQIFSKNMAQEINNAVTNRAVQQQKLENLQNSQAALTTLGAANPNPNDANSQNILNFAQYMQANAKNFNAEQMNQANAILQELVQNSNAATMAADKLKDSLSVIGTGITATTGESILAPFLDSQGAVNATLLSEALQNMSQSEVADMFSHIQEDIKPVREGLLEFNKALQDYQQELRNTNSTDDSWSQSLANLQAALDHLKGKIDPSTYERYEQAIEEISQVTENAGDKTAETTAEVAKLADSLEKVAVKDLTNLDQLNKDAFQAKNTQMAAGDSNKVAGAFQEGMGSQAHIQEILNTLNAVQQLTFAWQAFQNLGSLWVNEDLSTGEKVFQTIMNLTMAMPQLITAIQTLQSVNLFQKIGDSFNTIKDLSNIGSEAQQHIQSLKKMIEVGDKAKRMMVDLAEAGQEAPEKFIELAKAGDEARKVFEKAKSSVDEIVEGEFLAKESTNALATAFAEGVASAAKKGATGLGLFAGGLKGVAAAAAPVLLELAPFIAIGAAIAAIGFAVGKAKEEAEKAKEEALEAFDEAKSKLEEVQNLQSQVESFQTKFESMKEAGKGFDELAKDAEAFADALEEAGMVTESSTVRAAAYRAELSGTAEDFEVLAQEMERAQKAAEVQANNDNIEAATEVLNTQKADFNEIINKQAELAEQKRQLNKLEADDPGRKVIQDKINALQDYINKNKEAVDAVNAVRASQEAIAGMKIDATQGGQIAALGLDNATVRAGTEAKYEGARDTYTMDRVFGEQVQGWDSGIYSDLEKVDIMLNNVENDAERTSLKITDLLMESQGLTELEGHNIGYQGQGQHIAGTADYEAVMQQAGWTNEQALKFVASLDEQVSLEEFKKQVADLNNQITNDTNLDVLLDARLSDDSKEELVKDQVAAYQPRDEDVSSEEFQSLSSHFFENEDKMGVEGTPFEDYSEDLLNNAEALEEVVEGILRFNDAVESIDNNYKDWKEALSNTDDLQGQAEAIDDLQETYSDFLNLSEDMDVSEDFAANAENLDKMKEAAEGVEGAYEDLAMAAAEDILIHADVEDLDAAKAALEGLGSELPALFEGVDIGGALDLSSVENQINALADATGWSADQMAAYLNSIGIKIDPNQFQPLADSANATADAIGEAAQAAADNASMDVEANQVTNVNTSTDEKQFTDAYPHVNPHGAQWSIDLPTFSGQLANGVTPSTNKVTGWVPEITYTATPKSAKETKTDTSQATGYKYKAGQGATGKVHLKPNATATRSGGGSRPSGGATSSGGGGGGGSCFVAGTKISTYFGFKNIEDIQKNDIVLSYNEETQQNEYSIVLQTMIHNVVEPIYTLYIKNEQLRVTGIHRFLVKRNNLEWIPAQNIKVGDWILFADGTWHLIWKIDINIEHQIVYNFEVSNNHNYYVGYNQILVHNKGGKGSCFVAGTLVTTDSSFKPIEQIQEDDIVLSYNEKLGMNEYSKVLQTMIHNTIEPIYTLHIKGEKLRVTGIHRFFVTNKIINDIPQWVHAADLKVGDWVLFADGTWHVIHKIDINIEYQTVYNFEVSHNHNYYVGRNQILAHNKGGKGGGGGGGGSAKTIKPKEKKEHEKNYYEEVDNQLKKTEKTLSKIEKENDRLTGDKARANYDKQIELLKKEVSLQEKKLKILTEQEKVDVEAGLKKADKELEDLLNQNGITWKIPDPVYDEDGIISNYEQISEAIDKAHNEMIDKYNAAAAAGDEELAKQIEEVISKIDKKGEDLLKKAKRMNEIQTEIEDITATLENLKDSIEDIQIDVYKASQSAIDDIKEAREEAAKLDALFHTPRSGSLIDRWSIDDTPYTKLKRTLQEIDTIWNVGADDARAYYDELIAQKQKALEKATGDEKKAIQSTIDFFVAQRNAVSDEDTLSNGLLGMAKQDLDRLQKWMDDPSSPDNIFGDNIAALEEAYKASKERVIKYSEEMREDAQDARDYYVDLMDEIEDDIEHQIDGYDSLLDRLEQINDTYQLYYGEDSYDDILNIMDQQSNTMQSKLDQLTTSYNFWVAQYERALTTGDKELIREIEEKMNDAEKAMYDQAEELAEHFVERFEVSINRAIKNMTTELWGGGPGQMDLEDQSTMWELQKDYMSNYKDDVEKSFEIDKLRSKYIGLLNDAQGMSLQTQNKIRAQMQDQLDLLENQATMSEYDVKLANAKLEILQKQIALEDAQRNKNKMQLRRDTQGNYRYVYTADQGEVQQAQDELNESRYDAYEMTKEQTIANNDRAISLYNDYMEKIASISKKYQDDEAAREAALAALSAEYKEIFKALRDDYADTTNGMYDVLTWMIDNTSNNTTNAAMNMLNTLYDENGRVKEDTGVVWQDLATQISQEVLPQIDEAAENTIANISWEANRLSNQMAGPNGVLNKIGSSADSLKTSINRAALATHNLASATNELFGYLAADDGELARATKQMAEYEERLKGALSETSKLGEALRVANENLAAKAEEARQYKLQIERLISGEDVIENGQIVNAEELRKRKEAEAAKQAQQNDNWSPYSDAYGIWMHGDWGGGGYWYGNYAAANGTWKADQVLALFNSGYGYSWMDTGGYTGDWTENEGIKDAKSGKLAVLHKKELVLNATDTENILGAVSIIRQLSNTLQNNLGNLAAQSANQNNISGMYSPFTTEQRVEIQATFPNATDADDIRTALLGLSDKAFQYAHRTI